MKTEQDFINMLLIFEQRSEYNLTNFEKNFYIEKLSKYGWDKVYIVCCDILRAFKAIPTVLDIESRIIFENDFIAYDEIDEMTGRKPTLH